MNENYWAVVGCTWPYSPTVHKSRRGALRRAAELRRKLRADFPSSAPRGTLGVLVEPRSADYALQWKIHP